MALNKTFPLFVILLLASFTWAGPVEVLEQAEALRYEDPAAAEALVNEAIDGMREVDAPAELARLLHLRAGIARDLGRHEDALSDSERVETLAERIDDRVLGASSLHMRGTIEAERGSIATALERFHQARDMLVDTEARSELTRVTMAIGITYTFIKEFQRARNHYEQALALVADDEAMKSKLLLNLAVVVAELDGPAAGLAMHRKGLVLAQEHNDLQIIAYHLANICQLLIDIDGLVEANTTCPEAIERLESLGHVRVLAGTKASFANLLRHQGRLEEAEALFREVLESVKDDRPTMEIEVLENLAKLYEQRADLPAALDTYRRVMALHREVLNEEQRAQIEELEVRFGVQQRERDIEVLELDAKLRSARLQRGNTILAGMVVVSGLLAVLLVVIWRGSRELKVAKQAAESASLAKSTFLANISHEIRTPMNAVLGFAGLGMKLDVRPQALDYFGKISRSGNNLLALINDVLDFSKIEAGKLELESIPFDLHEVVHQVVDMFSLSAAEKNVKVVLDELPELPDRLTGDPLRLSQVLTNLVSNALKFTDQGFVRVKVERLTEPGIAAMTSCRLRFSVTDSGIGISEKQQERLFLAFSQADSSTTRHYGGSGLGLAICKQIVEQMGGAIRVVSSPGVGSTFSFEVAFNYGDAAIEKRLPAGLQSLKALVVDANQDERQALVTQLHGFGFTVTAAGLGDAASSMPPSEGFDLVVVDSDLLGSLGIDAIRAERGERSVPKVIVVARHGRLPPRLALKPDVCHVLIKPVCDSLLFDAVVDALGVGTARPYPPIGLSSVSDACARIRGKTVLLVEDNPINQQVAAEVLESVAVNVHVAGSGSRAVRMATETAYDAILMDIQMPGMDGYEATSQIRAVLGDRCPPIIAMTAHALDGYRERCLSAGMVDYLTKPIDADRLYSLLSAHVTHGEQEVSDAPAATSDDAGTCLPEALEGVNVHQALRRLNGDRALFRRLLLGFAGQRHCPSPQQLKSALVQGDIARATLLVHTIKGISANLSAESLCAAATALEQAIKQDPATAIDLCFSDFEAAFQTVLTSASRVAGAPSAEAVSLSSIGAATPVELQVLVDELARQLRAQRADAGIAIENLSNAVDRGTKAAIALVEIEEHVAAFDFISAFSCLKRWERNFAAPQGTAAGETLDSQPPAEET